MALMDFIKKQFIDIIHWTDDGDGVLASRFSMQCMECTLRHSCCI